MTIPAAIRIPAIYGILGILWIFFSDAAVTVLFRDADTFRLASTLKGWSFIALTSLLLYVLIRREQESERRKQRDQEEFHLAAVDAMNHITRNFLNKMEIVRLHAEKCPGFDREVLALYQVILDEAQQEIGRVAAAKPGCAADLAQRLHGPPAG